LDWVLFEYPKHPEDGDAFMERLVTLMKDDGVLLYNFYTFGFRDDVIIEALKKQNVEVVDRYTAYGNMSFDGVYALKVRKNKIAAPIDDAITTHLAAA